MNPTIPQLLAGTFLAALLSTASAAPSDELLTVYVARKIVTMDPTRPTATAVAVRGKRIVSVGSLQDLKPWLDAHPHTIDRRFADKVLMPGLIDPHLHPLLGALQFQMPWITPEAWELHDAKVPATRTPEQYWQRLKEELAKAKGDGKPIFATWGWSAPEHGPMTREMLDRLDAGRPMMILQRSVHEAVFNTVAIEWMKLKEENFTKFGTAANWKNGHFIEAGLFEGVLPSLASYLLSPKFVDGGFTRSTDYLIAGGITTVGDMATGMVNWDLEMAAIQRNLVDKQVPFRTVLVADVRKVAAQKGGLEASLTFIEGALNKPSPAPQLVYGKRIKLFADGAMFSQLGMMREPGYIDGHHGEWIVDPKDYEAQARLFWNAGYRIHVHANGDAGITNVLDMLQKLQIERPRPAHPLVIEHYGYADPPINQRVAALGAAVSANPYYLHALGDTYATNKVGFGVDRARRITPVASLVDLGVPVALHSDFGMAPMRPLFLAWSAITRTTASGKVFKPPRGLTVDEAIKAVTVNAAYVLGMEQDVGSIQSGKLADFAVLEADPYAVEVRKIKDIKVWGTVFEGKPTAAKAK